jgi:YHS domain-containing protein
MSLLLRWFVSPHLEQQARRHADQAATGHEHHMAGSPGLGWRARLTSPDAWSDVAHNFRGDWQMLYKEITIGFLLAGFIGLLGNDFFNRLLIRHAPELPRTLENVIVGPIIAALSFVCSVGNVPLAAVLWSGGISFAGVIAFLFADLIVLPIIAAYRKYYGNAYALRITALMFVTIVLAALIIEGLFSQLQLLPSATRPSRNAIFAPVHADYKLFLNLAALAVFVALMVLTVRRGVSDPVCGMKVDRSKAIHSDRAGQRHYFCSERCRSTFASDPERCATSGEEPRDRRYDADAIANLRAPR